MDSQKVLVIDDDKALCGVVVDFLQAKGLDVTSYNSVEAASDALSRAQFDLLILDWDLPGISGFDYCKQYRESGGLAPVLMMTGHDSIDDKEMGLEIGADDYLSKPFSLRELHARVKSMLRRSSEYSKPAPEPVPDQDAELMPGFSLDGKYRLEQPIGRGGMAQVWLATDLKIAREVVIKLMHKHLAGEEESMKRFEHECRLMAQIKHPNVVTIYDAGCYRNWLPYLVMEYIKGESLRDLIDERGPAPIKAAVAITTQICAGLQDAHDAGIVHRDLKPENIMIQDRSYRQDAVKIADFGIARLLGSKERITRDGMVIGTIEYISPEQLEDAEIDGRTDLYALGVMLFEILTGEMPFNAKTVEGMMMQHLLSKPELPSSKREDIAPGSDLDQIVEKCLQKKARNRFQSADELREALTRVWSEQN